ncbi:uncharacterized protein LOC135391601 [Ornithodoros turicata]|uniref:uncharacterized protein LOC135391601 n=1 Tax=Ornithodoros turicata TaxID=34597 RepID=UPI0031393E14
MFLQRLPPTVQMLLATATNLPIADLAAHADKIMEVAIPTIASVKAFDATSPNAMPPIPCTNTAHVNPNQGLPQNAPDSLKSLRAEVHQMSSPIAAVLPHQDSPPPPPNTRHGPGGAPVPPVQFGDHAHALGNLWKTPQISAFTTGLLAPAHATVNLPVPSRETAQGIASGDVRFPSLPHAQSPPVHNRPSFQTPFSSRHPC